MSHTYKSEFPAGVTVDSGIAQFFETFYQTSDTPEAHEKYADSFTKDATFILASKTVKGHDGMCTFVSLRYVCSSLCTWVL
jgi:hypothetical protein